MLKNPKQYFIRIPRWSCNDQSHDHKSEASAQACILKQLRPKKTFVAWTLEKRADVLARIDSGETLSSISDRYGVSRARIKQVADRERRRLQRENDHDFDPLVCGTPIREMPVSDLGLDDVTNEALRRQGIFFASILSKLSYEDLVKIPNIGIKSANLIREALYMHGFKVA